MSFENRVSRFRKLEEMIGELKEYVNTLTGERDMLEKEIVVETLHKPRLFTAFIRKTSSAGIVGRNMFTVTYSDRLCRTQDKARLDDQDWLHYNVSSDYHSIKLELQASKIKADFKAGRLDDEKLKQMGLSICRVGSLKVGRIPSEAELNAIREEAAKYADSIED